jgi:DNA/RNA endonuclease YhcR with UshA esterase domain
MKFVINFFALACLSTHALAGPIRVFYEDGPSRAKMVKDIFTESYQIPEDLIVLEEVKKCTDLMVKGKLDLCLNNNGDLLVVSVDRGFISESLKIFQAP